MSKEIYRVANTTRGDLIFQVYPVQDATALNAVASHHRRRAIRSAARTVSLQHTRSVDLIDATGLTVADLEFNVDLNNLIKIGHLQILERVKAGEKVVAKTAPKPEVLDVDKVVAADIISEAEVAAEVAKAEVPGTPLPPSFAVPVVSEKPAAKSRRR